ncbi:hypothetical protein [Eshraghiella crossota]
MIRFHIKEYIKNIKFNFSFVLIITFMMCSSIIFISNVDEQTKLYRFSKEYIDENSVFIDFANAAFISCIDNRNKVLISQNISGEVGANQRVTLTVYQEELVKKYPIKVDAGENINLKDKDVIEAVISYNPYGIDVGDEIDFKIYGGNEDTVRIKIVGLVSEGQKLFTELSGIKKDMIYEDFFPVYSFEQTGEVRMFISETDKDKIPDLDNVSLFRNGIVNPYSEEEGKILRENLVNYEKENFGFVVADIYPQGSEIVSRSIISYKSIVMKYIPLTMFILVLFMVCIIGIVMVKVNMDIKYYGILSLCGMSSFKLVLCMFIQMLINSILACIISVNLCVIQNELNFIGKINCNIDEVEILVVAAIGIVITLITVIETGVIFKKNTIIQIMRNR